MLGVLAEATARKSCTSVTSTSKVLSGGAQSIRMERDFDGCNEAYLTQSFRFGTAIAEVACQVLQNSGEHKPVRGNPAVAQLDRGERAGAHRASSHERDRHPRSFGSDERSTCARV